MSQNKFGIDKRKSKLEESINKWFFANITGNITIAGYIKSVEGREITLNPYKTMRYNPQYGCNLYELVHEDAFLEISPNGYFLDPTNEETIEYIIKKQNEEILKETIKRED
ncbi:MAG TPA: hypothetical protein PLA60_00055 [Candidatus Pacearchaeota archaeon]|jgi:hypothetical protein|nr:hypothetical protein [Candidatus Pacearchaeota archaeon]HQC60747.1 hypothetical protein [Candidatus Pacearchaeota archaeon]